MKAQKYENMKKCENILYIFSENAYKIQTLHMPLLYNVHIF